MSRAPSLLTPRRWPVRWRLAGVSAGLTFVILVCVAIVVGRLASDRLADDFRAQTTNTAREIALQIGSAEASRLDYDLEDLALPSGTAARVVDSGGEVQDETFGAPGFGPPIATTAPQRSGSWEVATYPVASTSLVGGTGSGPLFVQFARNRGGLEATVGRLWLLLAGGVLGGTVLATLAGLAVANRAMSPVAALTGAARRITQTRDPSLKIPQPESDDEVAELARTLEEMLVALDAAQAETEAMVESQREFVADASHELRTPLTSILANLELLEDTVTDPEDAEVVAGALGSTRRMRHLVADLLLLARADAGRTGAMRETELTEIARVAYGEVRPLAGAHELSLHLDAEPRVLARPDDLHRVIVNLLDNAVRHTAPGSRIELRIGTAGGRARIEVADDGDGVPEELRGQIFSRFARGEGRSDVRGDPGTGLGLAIVSAVADSHGGRVDVDDGPLGGARFTVEIPLLADRPAEPGDGDESAAPQAQQPEGLQKPRSFISRSI